MMKRVVLVLLPAFVAVVLSGPLCAAEDAAPTAPAPTITLPPPDLVGTMTLEQALAQRRSVRQYADASVTLPQLSQLLWAAQGITEPSRGLRTAPSAMATEALCITST